MADAAPQISVIVPAYNSARFIDEALASALAQTGPAIEVIVVDDGSRDDTVARVRAFGDRVRLIEQANQGSAVARNRGIEAARADHVAFLDADDYWHPQKLARQWERVQAGAPLVYSRFSLWEPDATGAFPDAAPHLAACQARDTAPARSGWLYIDLLLDCEVWTSTVLARKDLLQKVGGFDPSLRKGQDYDLWLKLAHEAPWEGVSESLALYRLHTENITRTVNPTNFEYRILDGAYRRWGLQNPDGRRLPEATMRQRLARSARNFADAHLAGGSRETALDFYRIALGHEPLAPRVWLNYARARWLSR
ncbi:glycosyltransferase family 2 protein [Roseateles cellulosilyticus]|uniref:Glycosyltransferase family 2 protein n=1 Tax=Pelomonas cellulosilytica TaxID=2906762 RepID=A0ABS8Y0A0_9BURK|nr:glycosyltransferase family A protein [Pelomonas sp. P8]MCE4557572.1 glycosyltransferase family 2 protein [Pelomonas sp. P8]